MLQPDCVVGDKELVGRAAAGDEIGLRREEGCPIMDSRTIDGFKVRIAGNHLIVSYSIEQRLSDVYAQKLEQEMEAIIAQCVNYLKNEYRKIAGKNLKLTIFVL